jgi:hypothetical protein
VTKAKTPRAIPLDAPTLSRWLSIDPGNAKKLQAWIVKASPEELERVEEPVRCGVQWAWDEQPDVLSTTFGGWVKNQNERLRRIAAGAVPMAHEVWRETAIKHLKKLAADKSPAVRVAALDQLLEDPNGQFDLVRKHAAAEEPEVRALVARHLAQSEGETLKKALPLLGALVLDPEPSVHWAAAATLCDLYERDPRGTLEVARTMAVSEVESIRTAVASSFFEHVLADAFDALLPTVRVWLRAPEQVWLRWTLVRSMRFVRVTPRSLALLKALYEDKDPELRRRVAMVLVDLFDARAEHGRAISELLRRAKVDAIKRVREVVEEGEARHSVDFDKIPLPGELVGDLPEELEGEAGDEVDPEASDDDDDD